MADCASWGTEGLRHNQGYQAVHDLAHTFSRCESPWVTTTPFLFPGSICSLLELLPREVADRSVWPVVRIFSLTSTIDALPVGPVWVRAGAGVETETGETGERGSGARVEEPDRLEHRLEVRRRNGGSSEPHWRYLYEHRSLFPHAYQREQRRFTTMPGSTTSARRRPRVFVGCGSSHVGFRTELNTVFLKKKETPLYTRWRHRALQEAQAQAQAQAEAQTQTLGVFKSFSTACCGRARTMP